MWNPLRLPSAEQIAARELEDAKRHLLESQSAREYFTALERCYQDRIVRLTARLKEIQ